MTDAWFTGFVTEPNLDGLSTRLSRCGSMILNGNVPRTTAMLKTGLCPADLVSRRGVVYTDLSG